MCSLRCWNGATSSVIGASPAGVPAHGSRPPESATSLTASSRLSSGCHNLCVPEQNESGTSTQLCRAHRASMEHHFPRNRSSKEHCVYQLPQPNGESIPRLARLGRWLASIPGVPKAIVTSMANPDDDYAPLQRPSSLALSGALVTQQLSIGTRHNLRPRIVKKKWPSLPLMRL